MCQKQALPIHDNMKPSLTVHIHGPIHVEAKALEIYLDHSVM